MDIRVLHVFFYLVVLQMPGCLSMRINITDVQKCPFIANDLPIDFLNVTYVQNTDGIADRLDVRYIIREEEPQNKDLRTEMYTCKEKPNGLCSDNMVVDDHHFNCEEAIKVIGPWTVAKGPMMGKNCNHESLGVHEVEGAALNMDFMKKFLKTGFTHYRMVIKYHVAKDPSVEGIISCVSVQFDEVP